MYGAKPSSVIDVIPLPLSAKAHPKALNMVEHMQQVHKEVKKRIEVQERKLKKTYIEEEELHFKKET